MKKIFKVSYIILTIFAVSGSLINGEYGMAFCVSMAALNVIF